MLMIETSRLLLRDFGPEDVAMLRLYHADPRYREHYDAPGDAVAIVHQAMTWAEERPRRCFQLAILCGADSPVIGSVGVRLVDAMARVAEVGAELAPEAWGKGYAEEALATLIDFARRELGLRRVEARSAGANHRAHRLMKRLGFAKVGPEDAGGQQKFGRDLE